MTKSTWIKTLLALLLSVCIAFYVSQFLQSLKEEVNVVVASKVILPESVITEDMLKIVAVHKTDMALLAPYSVSRKEMLLGSIALQRFEEGEVISNDSRKIVAANEQLAFAQTPHNAGDIVSKGYTIPPDKRATTVRVDSEGSIGFTLNPGDKVDVVFTSTSGETGGIFSRIILTKVEVFDVSEVSEKDQASSSSSTMQTVTLLVTPDQAQQLSLAKRKGEIDLLLNPVQPGGSEFPSSATYPNYLIN